MRVSQQTSHSSVSAPPRWGLRGSRPSSSTVLRAFTLEHALSQTCPFSDCPYLISTKGRAANLEERDIGLRLSLGLWALVLTRPLGIHVLGLCDIVGGTGSFYLRVRGFWKGPHTDTNIQALRGHWYSCFPLLQAAQPGAGELRPFLVSL